MIVDNKSIPQIINKVTEVVDIFFEDATIFIESNYVNDWGRCFKFLYTFY